MPHTIMTAVFALLLLAVSVQGQPDKSPYDDSHIKYNMDYLDKTFGIKLVKTKGEPPPNRTSNSRITLTLQFTKDVDRKEVGKAFSTPTFQYGAEPPDKMLYFHFFDEDNVQVFVSPVKRIEGELSGKQGDAFRVIIDSALLPKTKKIEVRQGEATKPPPLPPPMKGKK